LESTPKGMQTVSFQNESAASSTQFEKRPSHVGLSISDYFNDATDLEVSIVENLFLGQHKPLAINRT
jgi:hypothetical protein